MRQERQDSLKMSYIICQNSKPSLDLNLMIADLPQAQTDSNRKLAIDKRQFNSKAVDLQAWMLLDLRMRNHHPTIVLPQRAGDLSEVSLAKLILIPSICKSTCSCFESQVSHSENKPVHKWPKNNHHVNATRRSNVN